MKKVLAVLAILISLTGVCFAAGNEAYVSREVFTEDVLASDDSTSILVSSTDVVYTKAFSLTKGEYFALSYKATSTVGSPSLLIELQQSYALPETEGLTDANWVEPENMPDIESDLTAETQKHKSFSPLPLPYGRLKITGSATNREDTTLEIKLNKQLNG